MTSIPYLTTNQMREVDRAMTEDYHIELIQMMENAGRNLAHLARQRFLNGDPRDKNIIVLAGRGGNGGGGLVCARRLHNWGAAVQVVTTDSSDRFSGVPAHQLDILRRINIPIVTASDNILLGNPNFKIDLIVDAVIGYSLKGSPRSTAAQMILWANSQKAPILSLDVPSGIDTATGQVFNPAIRAESTLTLALPKEGLRTDPAAEYVGELYLADISVPPELYRTPGLELKVGPIFAQDEIIRL